MKFLYLTDTHLVSRGPSSRTDNYEDAIMEKFEEVGQVIKREGIQTVFHGGDLFDKPVVSVKLMGRIANFIHSTGVPWYVVPGNHDLFGYNIKSLPQTSLGLLSEAGVVTILDRAHGPVVFSHPNIGTVSFEGQEYHMDIDHRDPALDYFTVSQSDYRVLIPHSMLLDKEYFPDVPYTKVEDAAKVTEANLILVGHYHDGYPIHLFKNKEGEELAIYNPGSMARDEASKANLTRKPKYVILHWDSNVMHIDNREFHCASEGQDIFNRSHITTKQAKNRYLQSFEQKLSDVQLDAVDVRDVLDQIIAQDTGIDSEIATEAQNRLVEAELDLGDVTKQMTGYIEKPYNVYISEIMIKGFQSHEDTTIVLRDGLTAIIGPSDSGKSSIIRALRFALYNEPKGADFIRQGVTSAEVAVVFSDGSKIRRSRTRSSAGNYEIYDTQGNKTDLKGFSNNIPVDVPNTHQMPYIQLTKDLETTLNIGYQLDKPFLIGESAGTRAAIIGRLTGVNLVDTATREIGKDILGNSRDLKTHVAALEETERQIEDFNHLPELEKNIAEVSSVISKLELLERLLEELKNTESEWSQSVFNESLLIEQLKTIDSIQQLAPVLMELEQELGMLSELQNVLKEESFINLELCKVENLLHEATVVNKLEQFVTQKDGLEQLQNDIIKVTKEQNVLNQSLKELPDLEETVIKSLEETHQALTELRHIRMGMADVQMEIVAIRKEKRQAQINQEKAEREYIHLLESNGTCPTCNQAIIKGEIHVN